MQEIAQVLVWLAIVVGAIVAGIAVVYGVRRWAQREEPAQTFTFEDLRQMRERGDITEIEYAAMRNALLTQMEIDIPREGPPLPPMPPADPRKD